MNAIFAETIEATNDEHAKFSKVSKLLPSRDSSELNTRFLTYLVKPNAMKCWDGNRSSWTTLNMRKCVKVD